MDNATSFNRKSGVQRFLSKLFTNRTKRQTRSKTGNAVVFFFIAILAVFSAVPLVLSIGMSFKPLNELYMFPPKLMPVVPSFDSYRTLLNLMTSTWIPFTRYFFNTIFITIVGTIGHVLVASAAAYPLAKGHFRGRNIINTAVMFSLMFVTTINDIANYLIISVLGWTDTYAAIIVPMLGAPLGLFIMRNYISAAIPDSLLESAKLDGCNEMQSYFKIVMPLIRPAWLTVGILMFQQTWSQPHTLYIYSEKYKTLPYAISQITSGSLIKAGAAQAGAVLMLLVPAVIFIISQTKIVNAMATSGIKE